MRKTICILLLSVSTLGISQASNEGRDPLNQYEIEMELKAPNSTLAISVYKTATVNEKTFILKTETKSYTEAKGIILRLSSGEVLNFKDAVIKCEPSSKGNYKLKGSIPLTPELNSKLSQIEITEFQLGKTTVPVDYDRKTDNLKGFFEYAEQH